MSCLTAFLLVTAVWTQFAQINIKPKGLGREVTKTRDEPPPPQASILVTKNELWVGTTTGDVRRINKNGETHDWAGLKEVLVEFRGGVFADREDIEIAAEDD